MMMRTPIALLLASMITTPAMVATGYTPGEAGQIHNETVACIEAEASDTSLLATARAAIEDCGVVTSLTPEEYAADIGAFLDDPAGDSLVTLAGTLPYPLPPEHLVYLQSLDDLMASGATEPELRAGIEQLWVDAQAELDLDDPADRHIVETLDLGVGSAQHWESDGLVGDCFIRPVIRDIGRFLKYWDRRDAGAASRAARYKGPGFCW